MPIDYNSIRDDEIRKEAILDKALKLLGKMYTDRTHFVFELLQNAEDAGATRILFSLFDDRLEVTHDGRLFDEGDVRGVCGVGEGTKAEDLTQIGKFGIGFKSVYAYTATPEVHSGGESFRIENYVRPYAVTSKPAGNSWTTLFVFPFNTEKIAPETACKEIGDRLRNLSARTLLFLRRINEIEYRLPNSTGGVYLREEIARGPARQVRVIGQNNGKDEEENWLIFERPVAVPGNSDTVRVEVSFRLEAEDKAGKNPERIVKVQDSPLVVYFPTEKATRFGFLIQGPYRTTPSRDNIPKDDEWNETLVKETAELIGDILSEVKDVGLLSVSFLEALPIRTEDFPGDGMFYPIVESVRNTLIKEELLPTDDGSFVSAGNAKLASADWLRKLLRQVQLKLLYQRELKWIHGDITDKGRHELWKYFREELKVEELTPDGFARRIGSAFLANQSDQWIIDFYAQLPNQKALWKKGSGSYWDADGPLRKKPFIRLQDGSHVRPFGDDEKPNAYLTTKTLIDARLPTVKTEIAGHDEARRFLLSDLKIPEFDIVAEVTEHVIPKYTSPNLPKTNEHERDIEKILEAFQTDSQENRKRLKDALQETPFILSRSFVSGNEAYRRPDALYFQDGFLEIYFSENSEVGFVSSSYQESALEIFANLGVSSEIRVKCKSQTGSHDYVKLEYESGYRRGLRGFDPDISVEGLSHALLKPSIEKSQIIWNKICVPYSRCIKGKVLRSSRQDFSPNASTYKEEELVSEEFGKLLIDSPWLPTGNNEFKKPAEISLDELPNHFERDEKLADLLGMKKDVVTKLAEEAGVKPEIIEYARNNPQEIEKLIAREATRRVRPTFPDRPVANPERRQERLGEQLSDTPDKEYEKRERSVQVPTEITDEVIKTWLRNQYTNDENQMVCQICKMEHFRKRNGEHHFEKKEVLTSNFLPKKLVAQYLALCPLCAAKYDEFVKTDDAVMAELREEIVNTENCEIPISLGDEKTSIRFVETHYHDLKTIIEGVE